jgi:D-alanyl-D-alanine carboxypeptidase-like protein
VRRLLLVTVMLLSTVATAAPAGAASPIQPSNQPTPVPGATNGELPASDLITVARHCQAFRAAAPSLGLLLATAREQGVALGTEECYRSLAGQQQEQQTWTAAGNSACAAPVVTSPSGGQTGTSMHGWGKAADFSDAGGSVLFGSPAYRFLQATAGRFGWNHPGWAQPGGSACPEAWHWEWVGDGGTMGATPIEADTVAVMPAADGRGYSTVTGLGAVVDHGDAAGAGPAPSAPWLIAAAARTPSGGGYWLAGEDGSVFATGDAGDAGSMAGTPLNAPVVGMAPTPDGGGYWLVASDGGIFSFGDAHFWGSTGAMRLNRPIVGMAATPDGRGYWLVASDGGIFSFGDAHFWGSTGATALNAPVVGMTATPDGRGYLLVAADGGIFTFGTAHYAGSAGNRTLAEPAVGIARTPDGGGYWIGTADGSVLAFGDAAP